MTALHTLSAVTLSRAYRNKSLSPLEVARSVLAQAERCEPTLHASYLLRPELALAQARASEQRWQRGEPLSDLDGVPVTIKDNIATQGDPMPLGTAATTDVPMPADAPPSARLREAGAVFICKTTMPDYGMLSSGTSSFHATARNPWMCARRLAAPARAPVPLLPRATAPSTWAPTSVVRSDCLPAGAACSV